LRLDPGSHLAAATLSKWRDAPRLREFGAPERAIAVLAAALPIAQFVTAVLLLTELLSRCGLF
jgi:hypothetical protein